MEPSPSTSKTFKDFTSPQKKLNVSHFSETEKMMIVNVYKYIKQTWPIDQYQSKTEMKDKTASILGISRNSVYCVLREYTKSNTVKPPASAKSYPSIIKTLDSFDKSCIRKIVHGFYLKGEVPTLNKVLQAVNSDETLPDFNRTSLWRMLKHLKFKYVKNKRNIALIERDEIVMWRIKYLKTIKKCRQDGRPIYYLDETWVNAGHTVSKSWKDTTVKSSRQAFLEGLSTGAKIPTAKGNRLIVVHIGSKEGFVPESQWVFQNKETKDYHETMNADNFENWFKNVLPRLKPNAVVVMDNASYHSRHQERVPVTNWLKLNIQEWLTSKEVSFEDKETKVQLLAKVKAIKDRYQTYVTDEMAKAAGVEVLRLPPYHCELNPIELVWAEVKGHVARHYTTFKLADVKILLEEGLNKISEAKWRNCEAHVVKEEDKLNGLDHNVDRTIDSFIINVTDSSSSSKTDTETEDET